MYEGPLHIYKSLLESVPTTCPRGDTLNSINQKVGHHKNGAEREEGLREM
jgi:hypothetical protein